jgi:2-(1,2-epoxy-1,2-dihydrophenyl)acetyl-CoA isomerase
MTAYPDLIAQGLKDDRDLVTVDRRADRAALTMTEPERLNPLSPGIMVQLQARLDELVRDPAVRSVILTGSDPAFSAGGDLEMIAAGTRDIRDSDRPTDTTDPWRWIRRQFGGVVRTIVNSDTTFIAAVNGPAAGVGLAFALACDVIIASDRAVLVPAFGRLGLVPEVGSSWLLTRRLGYHGAFAYYLRGQHLDAAAALAAGLVEEVHPHAELLPAAEKWCDRVAAMPPHAIEMTKPLLRAAADATWEHSLRLEEYAEASCFSTETVEQSAREHLARDRSRPAQ